MDKNEILDFYRNEIVQNFWPFWEKAYDPDHGGVFTCFSNDGTKLISTDKYTWSQGRFLWLCSELYRLSKQRLLTLDEVNLKEMADKTYEFLKKNTLMKNNHVLYAVTNEGERIESQTDISVYADCFLVLGVNKYAEVFQNQEAFNLATVVYESINMRLNRGNVKTEPYPIPTNYLSHSIYMIMLNVTQELEETAKLLSLPSGTVKVKMNLSQYILKEFILEDGRCIELKPQNEENEDTLLARHVNPGHILEAIWFHIHSLKEYEESMQQATLKTLSKAALKALDLGWDNECGGLLRFVDLDGKQPSGRLIGDMYEKLIIDTWDTKLWWPHSEALYTLLLLFQKTNDKNLKDWYMKIHDYSFTTFPNPDQRIREWIQIRDRAGVPLNKVVALPVKDPFHIIRNFILIIKLFS